MKTKIHAFFLSALTALFAASASWAADVELQGDAQTGYYINMPATGTDNLTLTADDIAGGITSFKVYDDGGENGYYSNSDNGYLEITAPAGYLIGVAGSMIAESKRWDNLTIFDGSSESSTKFLDAGGSEESGARFVVGPFVSTGNVLTVNFVSDGSNTYEGLYLNVAIFDPAATHTVSAIPNMVGGSISAQDPVVYGTHVTLTLTPDENYIILQQDILVTDEYGNYVEAEIGSEGGVTTVSFDMPYSNVTVNPGFVALHNVTINSFPAKFGTLESDHAIAYAGEQVTLTASPVTGAELVSMRVWGADDATTVNVNLSGNTATFTMPDQAVYVYPVFANPTVVTFDENGCLDNGTYFHLDCNGDVCTISQDIQRNPQEGDTDFKCWYLGTAWEDGEEVCEYDEELEEDVCDMVYPEKGLLDILEEQGHMALTLKLGTSLNFGGYDSENNKCVMPNFEPISLSEESPEGVFDGQHSTVSGFCYESTTGTTGGFVTGALTVRDVTFDNAHVVVKNATSGSVVGVITARMEGQNSSFTNVHVTNSYVAGTQVGAFVGNLDIDDYQQISFDVTNSSVENTKVYGLSAATTGVMVPAAGGFVGYASNDASLRFTQATVSATTPGAGLVADDASYVGTGSYRGGFVGYQSYGDSIVVSQATVSGLSVSGEASDAGAIVGSARGFHIENSNFENITVSGANAGGIAGYVGGNEYGQWFASDVILSGANSVTGSARAGGLLGWGSLQATATNGDKVAGFENIQAAVNVYGENNVGGLAGTINNASDARATVTVAGVSVTGNVVSTATNMASAIGVGGLIGSMSLQGEPDWSGVASTGALSMMGSSFNGNVSFSNAGATQQMLYMGPLFGLADGVNPVTIFGCYSNGDITYSGIDAANAQVGYLGGHFEATEDNAQIIGNYHYGSDAVAVGLGNMGEATWKTGSDAFTANVRNAATGLTADGDIGFYGYKVYNNDVYSWGGVGLFEADLSGDVVGRIWNGVASEDDMKSMKFAALMNFMQSQAGNSIAPTWVAEDGLLPVVTDMSGKRNYLVILYSRAFSALENDDMPLSVEQLNALGVKSLTATFNKVDDELQGGTGLEFAQMAGFWGYTDANGRVDAEFVSKLQSVGQALEAVGSTYTTTYGSPITTNTVFTETAQIQLNVEGLKTYDIVYQYCTGTPTIECVDLDASGQSLLFISPLVSQINNGTASYTTLIPDAIQLGENKGVSWIVKFQDEGENEVGEEFTGSSFATFSEALESAPSDAQKIVVGFYDLSVIPEMVVKNPSAVDFKFYAYGYNDEGGIDADNKIEVNVTSDQQNFNTVYAASLSASDFPEKVGYDYDSYSVSFTLTKDVYREFDGRVWTTVDCDDDHPIVYADPVKVEGKQLPSYDNMYAQVSEGCRSASWIVSGFGKNGADDALDLKDIQLLKAQDNNVADTLAIIPNYVAKPYNIVFNYDGESELGYYTYSLFVARDYNDPERPQNLDAENVNFPVFFGTSKYQETIRLAGWTLDESKKNCVIYHDDCYQNTDELFVSLTPELITAAGDADPIQLYPVWDAGSYYSEQITVALNSCVSHNGECYEYPISFTLSQDVTVSGNAIHLSSTSGEVVYDNTQGRYWYAYGVKFYTYANNVYPVDFAYEVTPGFKVNSVTPPMYNEETDKLDISGYNNLSVSADFSVLSYNVKFNLDAVGDDVYLGRGTVSSGVMSYENGKYVFPPMYGRPTYGDDVEMTEFYRNNVFYGKFNWGVKNGEAYEGGSRDFDSKLVSLFEGNDYYVAAANEGENASMTLYANYVEPMPLSGSSNYTKVAEEIHVCAIDEGDDCIDGDGSEFHGSLVLSQSYDNDAEDVHWRFEHASEPVVQRAEDYELDEDFVRHIIYIPSHDDTLTFDVSVRPDPGYTMTIAPNFTYGQNFNGISPTNAGQVTWGFNAADATSGTLNIQPDAMSAMVFRVRYTQLAYNVAFSRPEAESGLFVGNKSVEGNYQMDWLESAEGVTAETIHAPAVYNGEGCRIAWKVAGREVESRTNTDVVNELPFMAVVGDDEENPVVNTLELDDEHIVANECSGSYQLTLDAEGEGEVYFIQKIGDEPVGNDDPEQTVITHAFVSAGDDQPLTLSVPKVVDATGREVGVKLTVVAVPADGYVLDALSYDIMFNGNSVTVLAQDSAELNIMENQNWHVKFEQYKPVYVKYDLALGEEDSSKVWIPADAVPSGSLQIAADGSDAPMWIPYRTDKCFSGWSMYAPDGPRPEVMTSYTEVSTWNIDEFSSDMASPTQLYATWVEYAEGCNQPSVRATLSTTHMSNDDSLVLTQTFDNAVFMHRGRSFYQALAYNPAGYKVSVDFVLAPGYEFEEDDPELKTSVFHYVDGTWKTESVDAGDECCTIGNDNAVNQSGTGPTYYFERSEKEINYSVAYNVNAGDITVFYGENWNGTATKVVTNTFDRNVFSADACLTGWSFDQNAVAGDEGVYRKVDETFIADYDARVANGDEIVLYGVWNRSFAYCLEPSVANATVALSDGLKGKATVELIQEVGGVETVVAVVGDDGIEIPEQEARIDSWTWGTESFGDYIYFTKLNVVPNVGYSLSETVVPTYQIGDGEPVEIAEGMTEFGVLDNMVITATAQAVPYNIVYHENADDAAVFYGEHWSSTATLNVGDSMTMSIFRTDACLAGWMFNDNGLVYQLADADFIAELASLEIDGDIDLYAVWSADGAACLNPIQNVAVSLSDDLKGKATVELLQEVEGESKVVATVGAEGAMIPKVTTREVSVNGGTEVVGDFAYFSGLRMVPAAGYALSETVATTYKVGDAEAVEVTADPQPWTMTANTVISGAVDPVSYTVAFDVNAGSANVFYPSDWPENASAVQYDITMDEDTRQFPKAYRTDKCLVRYGFSKDASKAESFAAFDADFVNAYDSVVASGVQNPVLYAVWNECSPEQTLYTVTLNEPVEGTLVLSQHGNSYEVPSTGLKVPAAPLGIVFTVSFNVNDGYKLDDNGVFSVDDGSGEFVALEDGLLVVDGDKIVDAPATGKPYTFAFDVNVVDGTNVFYGDAWKASDNFALATEEVPFPTAVYRVGACLDGWTISKDAATAYTHYNAEFVAAVENANKAGLAVSTLYAKWGDCNPEQTVVTVSNSDAAAGTFTLSRTVSGTTAEYAVGETALQIPADEALDFTVSYAVNKGYTYNAMNGISAVDAADAPVEINDDVLNVATSLTLSAAVSADEYTFTLAENAGNANVFYTGTLATSFSAKITDDEVTRTLPANLYRSDACLVGWNFTDNVTEGFKRLDAEFVAAYKAAVDGGETPETLYAVWDKGCEQVILTVTSADKGKGVLTLAQGSRSYEVGDSLLVPSTENGIVFTASFAPATGYAYNEAKGFTVYGAQGIAIGTLENATATVTESISIAANELAESEFAITFDMNAGDATVYYGNPAEGASPKYTYAITGQTVFPMNFYRTDACLTGWRVTADPAEGETVFTDFETFVAAVAGLANYTGTLYAVWGTCSAVNNVTVAQAAPEMGTLTLVQRDANGNAVNTTEIVDAAVTLPLGNGDVEFAIEYTPNPGYSKVDGGYFYTVDANGNNLAALVNDRLVLAGNTIVKAPAKVDAFAVVFDVNAAAGVNVFYGNGWNASGSYDISMAESELAFPTEVYRVGYRLVGWSLEPIADGEAVYYTAEGGPSGYENTYQKYDENSAEVLKANGTSSVTMYAVWMPDANQTKYTVALTNPNAGSLTLSQNVAGAQSFTVGSDALEVPAVSGGLLFAASAELNSGYFANGNTLYLIGTEGNRVPLIDGVLSVDGNKNIEIPVESDGVQFVFVENTDAHVFYEDGWNNTGFFSLEGTTEFPKGLLRADAQFLGWALSPNSSKYYQDYDEDFVADLRNARMLGMQTETLYAVWMEYGVFDNVVVSAGNEKNGSFLISQTVNGVETAPLEVSASGIEIPNSSKLTFNVRFELNAGYYISSEEALQSKTSEGTTLDHASNGGTMHLGAVNSVLQADVAATRYLFAYNVNAEGTNVFYGDNWSSHEEKTVDDEMHELPHNIYRADARLVGWSTDSTATEGSFDMSSEFVQNIANGNTTLYAVWEPAEVETYRVSFANTNVGSLVLTQDVEDSTVAFNVSDTGLVVPVVEDGLHFKAAYTLNAGYAGSTDSLYRVDDLGEFIATLSSGELTVDQDVTLAIPTSGESYKIVFNVNREKEILFHGSDWVDSRTYMMTGDSSSFPLPAYLYTADACMVGWSLSKKGGEKLYTEFSSDLVEELKMHEPVDSAYTLYAIWGNGSACDDAYNRISLQTVNGTVRLVEADTEASESPVEHIFAIDNTIILPKVVNGNMFHVVSIPDSSYVLDSLVTVRLDGVERLATFEGGSLPSNLTEASLVAYFGKANRSAIAFVDTTFSKTGNAVQFEFTTSEFEVTRGVSARVVLETLAGDLIAVDTLSDSIVPPYRGVWERYPLAAGQYVLTAILSDEKDTVEYVREFEVTAEIAAVSAEGWQMISIGNLDKDALVWDDDQKFFWWDESSAFGDFWQYKELAKDDEIDPARGYWYSSLEGRTLALKPDPGKNVETVVWSLDSINSGWNLVANPVGFALNIFGDRPAENSVENEGSKITFWRWNADIADYVKTDVLEPYEAVWAKVSGPTEWTVPVRPKFKSTDSTESEDSAELLGKRLAKANGTSDWRLQMVLSDANGHRDSWNVLGVSQSPFASEEPPEGMGDHVKLAVLEGSRLLAESVRAPAEEQEWTVSLNANSDRFGELSFSGASDLKAYGLSVFVTIDGRTVEVQDDSPVRVALKSSATRAVVRVAPSAKVVAGAQIEALRALQSGRSLNVTFDVSENLNGARTMVDLVNMDGHVVATRSLSAMAGANQVALDAPKPGVYMLRVRAGSQMRAGRILVK